MVDGARCSQVALRTGVATAQTCSKVALRTGVAKTSSFSDNGGGVRARAAGGAKSGRAPARRGSNAEGGSPCDAGWSTEDAEWWPENQRVALSRRRAAPGGAEWPVGGVESAGGAESPTGGAGGRQVACRRRRVRWWRRVADGRRWGDPEWPVGGAGAVSRASSGLPGAPCGCQARQAPPPRRRRCPR